WNLASLSLKSFQKYDDCVYKVAKDFWGNDPMNGLCYEVTNRFYNMLIYAISEGKEKDFFAWSDRFDSPGGSTGKKPVVWERDGKSYAFLPERLQYCLFNKPSRRGYLLAKGIYKKCKKLEDEYETKIHRSKSKKFKNK